MRRPQQVGRAENVSGIVILLLLVAAVGMDELALLALSGPFVVC